MNWFHEMTNGPWWVDLTAFAGTLTAVGVIIRILVWPGLKAIWRAIVAAPQLAAGVVRLVDILETDILHRVELLEAGQSKQGDCLKELNESILELRNTIEKISEGL